MKERKMQNNYIYSKSGTDITIRWQKLYGYVPPSKQGKYIKKWADFRESCTKTLDDLQPAFPMEVVNLRFKQR
jgi:hypothetical protein